MGASGPGAKNDDHRPRQEGLGGRPLGRGLDAAALEQLDEIRANARKASKGGSDAEEHEPGAENPERKSLGDESSIIRLH